jgi:uncharacterized protein YdaU (DUF1376 family)
MAKDPAFLFYPNDYIGGTMGMTFEEKGAYMELLMLQFNRGHMTKDMIGRTVGQLWVNIKDKFIQDAEGLYYNERLELEKTKRKTYSESRRNNRKGVNQYTKKKEHKSGHMTSHMENVNENVNSNESLNKKGVVLKDRIPTVESFIAYGLEQAAKNRLNVTETAISMKYEAWKENGWVNGNGQEIRNWKSSLLNTLKHIQETEKGKPKKPETKEEEEARVFMEAIKDYNTHKELYGEESANEKFKFNEHIQPNINNNRLT